MSWFQKLHETYQHCYGNSRFADGQELPLLPVGHASPQVHIHVTLDKAGKFVRAELLGKQAIIIPVTEESAGRVGKLPPPHPLIDKVQYCASDYPAFGGGKNGFFEPYEKLLREWVQSPHSHPKVTAVYNYIRKGTVVADLVAEGVLHIDANNTLLTEPAKDGSTPIFKFLGSKDQGGALVCWSVEAPGVLNPAVWNDLEVQKAWIAYDASREHPTGLCMVTGSECRVAANHPRNIRRPGDGAKLISSNDDSGYTFRGKFLEPEQACTVGYDVSCMAHNALRWLIARQGYRNDDLAVVAWAVKGKKVPNPVANIWDVDVPIPELGTVKPAEVSPPDGNTPNHMQDMGKNFSQKLRNRLAGYSSTLEQTDEIVILGLDSATTGRLSVIFYREMLWSAYMSVLGGWQEDMTWMLCHRPKAKAKGKKEKREPFWTGYLPTPEEIAVAAYGSKVDKKLKANTVSRLLPCIADNLPFPQDLVATCFHRACKRVSMDSWEWEATLSAACAVYKGFYARHSKENERRFYSMALDENSTSRDYLYGRLLAVAEHMESVALHAAKEERLTNAERLMQRFADHPMSTWRSIRTSLEPYRARLLQQRSAFLIKMDKLLDKISYSFDHSDFNDDSALSGEFLLGYHCQRYELFPQKDTNGAETTEGAES